MTEEQRKQVAAQRCADLANVANHFDYVPTDFTEASGANKAFLNAILQLDELARTIRNNLPKGHQGYLTALKYILPEPKPSPVERLAERIWDRPTIGDRLAVGRWLDELSLQLVEKHILPEPKPTPVERLERHLGYGPDFLQEELNVLGLEIVEKNND